jgi:hypothetical protein
MSNKSSTYELWENPPIVPHFKVYFLNLTNPEEAFNGVSKPRLQEVGPYTYHQKWIKQNVTWHDNGTISYKTQKVFTYVEELSCLGCNESADAITTLNVPALSAYHQMKDSNWVARGVLNQVIGYLDYNPWVTKSPKELIWGYDEPLFDLAKLVTTPPPFEKFGLFMTKQSEGEHLGLYTMYTGEGNPYNLSNIAFYNGQKQLNFWKTDECNRVHGSDGSSFNPYIKEDDTLWFFNDQLCRALPLTFDQNIDRQGLPAMRFKPREDVLMSSKKFPKNSCFDVTEEVRGDGIFDLTKCQFNAPIIISWPHFLDAEPRYSQAVEGLSPNRSKHGFWFDIQGTTGTTLSAKARVQINMALKKNPNFDSLSKINDTIFPILWFEEGIDELGEDIITTLKGAVILPSNIKEYILYCLLGVCGTVIVLFSTAVIRLLVKRISVAEVDKVCDRFNDILHTGPDNVGSPATQPMLPGDSLSSSRSTSATHSRNSSDSSTIINYDIVNIEPGISTKREKRCVSMSSNGYTKIKTLKPGTL